MMNTRTAIHSSPFRTIGFILAAAIFLCPGTAFAQKQYPSKPVEIIVTFAAGGAVDLSVRILASEAEKYFGQKILITNKTGGGGTEGIIQVAKAKPDGYTLLALTSAAITNLVTKDMDYRVDSFTPVMMFTYDPAMLAVNANSPYATLEDFLTAAKSKSIALATAGHGTANHIACVLLESKYNVQFKYIHTKGAAEVSTMVAGGHVPSGVGPWADFRIMTEQGKLRIIGVMSEARDPRLPNVPTLKEKGFDIIGGVWRGIAVPQGTPQDIVDKLYQSFKKAIESKILQDKYGEMGFPIVYKNPKDFQTSINDSYESYKKILPLLLAELK
jgi:tripartite-type tricarboxylate transporter receptor subunit TctC